MNVSLDSLQKEKYKAITRRDSFNQLWNNIELLQQNDFQVKLNVVLIKGFNDNEILDFIALTKAQKLQIRFIEFMPFDGNQWNKEKLVSYAEIIEQVHSVYSETQLLRITRPAQRYR